MTRAASNYYGYSGCYTNHRFTNANGDGVLSANGNATGTTGWNLYMTSSFADCNSVTNYSEVYPVNTNYTSHYIGLRGGSFTAGAFNVSRRTAASYTLHYHTTLSSNRQNGVGFRGVRSAPANL
jgi:hypothetical protein